MLSTKALDLVKKPVRVKFAIAPRQAHTDVSTKASSMKETAPVLSCANAELRSPRTSPSNLTSFWSRAAPCANLAGKGIREHTSRPKLRAPIRRPPRNRRRGALSGSRHRMSRRKVVDNRELVLGYPVLITDGGAGATDLCRDTVRCCGTQGRSERRARAAVSNESARMWESMSRSLQRRRHHHPVLCRASRDW